MSIEIDPVFGIVADSDGHIFTPGYSRIDEGVNTIMVTWSSSHALQIHRSPIRAASTRVKIGQIPEGAVGRREILTIPGVGVSRGEEAYLSFTSAASAGTRVSAQVINIPLRAGGGSLRRGLGAARRLVAGWAK